MSSYSYLAAAIALTVAAQLLLKYAATLQYTGVKALINGFSLPAYTLLLLVTVLMVKALQLIPLVIVTAWGALTYLLVVIASVVLFKEGALRQKLFGCCLIIAGIILFELPV